MLFAYRRVLFGWLLSLLLLAPSLSIAQTELINSNVVIVGHVNMCIVTVGATDAYACNLGRTITAYQPWTRYSFIPNVANTGPAALALNGLASLPIKKLVAGVKTDLITGDIAISQPVEVYYDGTEFVWASSGGGGGVTTDTSGRAAFYNATTTVDGAPGLTFATDGTTIQTLAYRRTARSASATLDTTDGPVIECSAPSANVTLLLPSTAGTQTWFHIIKADATAFPCIVQASSGQRINGTVDGTQTLTTKDESLDLYVANTATPNWHGVSATPLRRYLSLECVADATALTTGDGKCYFPVPPDLAGVAVIAASAHVGAVVSSSGVVTIDADVCGAVATGIRCSGTNRDLFSTNATIDANEDGTETGTAPVITTAANANILAVGEWLRGNIDAAGTGTQGLYITFVLQRP